MDECASFCSYRCLTCEGLEANVDLKEAIYTRRSVREYTAEPVSESIIRDLRVDILLSNAIERVLENCRR